MVAGDNTLVRLATVSIIVSLIVLALKLLAWQLTGSVALYSDALESIINVATATIAWWAIRISLKPADDDHPFGHHKAEYFSAVINGVLIVLAALLIFREAALALTQSRQLLASTGQGVLISLVATTLNLVWARVLICQGQKRRSPALGADGRHIMSDVWTTLGSLAGLVVVLLSGWVVLDALMALLVGANILHEGLKVIRASVDGLMDKAVTAEEDASIRATILSHAAGAIEVHDIKTRSAGKVRFAEFHLVVDGDMTVANSHAICDRIENALEKALPDVQITIHVEPDHKRKADSLKIK